MKLRPGQLLCIAAILLVGLNLRPALAVISPLIETIRAATGLSYQAMGWVTGIPIMAMGVLALAGSSVYRLGMRRGVAIGILLVFVACLLRLLAADPAWLMGSALLAGIGIGITQTLVPGFIKQHFPQNIDTLMALYVSMIMGGAAMSAAGTPVLLHSLAWQPALAMWAVPALLGLALWLFATRSFRDPAQAPATAGTPASTAVAGSAQAASATLRPWRHARAWLLAGLFCASGSCYTLALAWLAPYYIELGATPQRAGLLLAVLTLFEVAAGFLVAWLAPRNPDRRYLLAACTLLASLGYVMLAWMPLTAPWLIIAILGLGIGALFPLTLILAMDHASVPRNAGVLAAFVQGIGYLVAGLLPFAAGQLRDSLGSLESAWSLMAGVVLLSLILIARASPASAKAFDRHCRQG
ncbi:MFS transporter [Kerstersia similis]|uniref:MFS transporter n=1 Tax=Kerstersia similis TaxID=206505 RepID=UPI0039F142E4